MATSNPAFSRNPAFTSNRPATADAAELQALYDQPSAGSIQTGRMSVEDTVVKTVSAFAVLVVAAVVGWFVPALLIPGLIAGLVLGFVNVFKRKPSAPLILGYAAAEGVFIGAISMFFEQLWPGIVVQATVATLAVVGVTLALFASGKIRASKRATKVFLIAIIGYTVFSLLNFGLVAFGAIQNPFGMRGVEIFGIPLGVAIGIFAVLLAAYSLVLDFDFIQRGVKNRLPREYGWSGAFGVMMTVIWLYVEMLRLIALSRN